jgi:hypothetical protein
MRLRGFEIHLEIRKGAGFLVGVFFWLCALCLWIWPINGAGYLLGLGEKVTVTVEKPGYVRDAGDGYYERDGERVRVRFYEVGQPGTVSATLPLIPMGIGVGPIVYVKRSQAVWDIINGIIGGLVLSLTALGFTFSEINFLRDGVAPR